MTKEWPIRKFGELADQITDGIHNSPPYVETGVPMLDSKHVKDGFVIDDTAPEKFISLFTDKLLAKRSSLKPATFLSVVEVVLARSPSFERAKTSTSWAT